MLPGCVNVGAQMLREQEEAEIEGRHMLDLADVELKEAAMRHSQVLLCQDCMPLMGALPHARRLAISS